MACNLDNPPSPILIVCPSLHLYFLSLIASYVTTNKALATDKTITFPQIFWNFPKQRCSLFNIYFMGY